MALSGIIRPPLISRFVCYRSILLRYSAQRVIKRQFHWTPIAAAKSIKLTTDTYPDLKRNPSFATVSENDLSTFRSILGSSPTAIIESVTQDASQEVEGYNSDWLRKYNGQSKVVLRPESTEQVSAILKHCNDRKLAVVPQGGNTGLVGGSVPVFDEIVISMQRMNQIRYFDPVSGILVADAGVVLEVADNYLKEQGYIFPLDLGAKGSCHIGGNVATNAGGLRLLRYGSLHGSVLGVEAVLPDGTIVDDLSRLRKNNTGYDLKQLFIGAEGTLGIITGVSVLCPQRSPVVNVAYLGLESFDKVLQTFVQAKKKLGEILSAFELMDNNSQRRVRISRKLESGVLEKEYPFYVLIETSGSDSEGDYNKVESLLADLMENEVISDGTIAQDQTQISQLWSWREGIPEALNHHGACYKYDLSVPIQEIYHLVEDTRARMIKAGLVGETEDYPIVDVVGYGHMGDGNLHLNVPTRRFDKKVEKELEPFVYEWVSKFQGSISAEHGLGLAKKPFIGYSRSNTMLSLMRRIKDDFDPVSLKIEMTWRDTDCGFRTGS
jgi:(R)-2-hydroxyglutarate---pyruvate transhydrogenase